MCKKEGCCDKTATHWFCSHFNMTVSEDTVSEFAAVHITNKHQNLRSTFKEKYIKHTWQIKKQAEHVFYMQARNIHIFSHDFYLEVSEFYLLLSCFQINSSRSSCSTVYRVFALNRCSKQINTQWIKRIFLKLLRIYLEIPYNIYSPFMQIILQEEKYSQLWICNVKNVRVHAFTQTYLTSILI